jgi:hypothetical protein
MRTKYRISHQIHHHKVGKGIFDNLAKVAAYEGAKWYAKRAVKNKWNSMMGHKPEPSKLKQGVNKLVQGTKVAAQTIEKIPEKVKELGKKINASRKETTKRLTDTYKKWNKPALEDLKEVVKKAKDASEEKTKNIIQNVAKHKKTKIGANYVKEGLKHHRIRNEHLSSAGDFNKQKKEIEANRADEKLNSHLIDERLRRENDKYSTPPSSPLR